MLNNTNRYAKKHGTGSSSGGTTIILGSQSQTNIPLDLNVDSITANKGDISKLIAHSANINDANIIYLMSGAGQITKINGDDLNYEEGYIGKLTTDELEANTLTVNNTAQIKSLIAEYIQSNDIHTDYLTVNKSAHFFELIIDKIRSVQGTQINTAANCIADYVEAYDSSDNLVQPDSNNVSYYRIYWRNVDDDGRAVHNEWLKYDQALCETFNVNTGTSYDVSNKYYWRLVNNTSNESGETIRYVNFNTKAVSDVAITDYVIELDDFEFEVTDTTSDSYEYVCDNFEISSQISNQWDAETNEWTVTSTVYGLQMKMMNSDDEYVGLTGGIFSFSTNIPTRLNVGFYYDDNTFEFFPADDSYKTSYSCQSHNNAAIEAIVITSATVETYEACNWIDLSNTDMDQTLSGKSAIPSVGDNISQLGYRYTSLPNYQNTDSWRNAHKDDIARASAIIIAAYQTPDSGVFPPSYAQYKNITDYNLSSHRHTYFDAQGSKFYGNFYIGTGDNTGSYTPVSDLDAEVYKIVPNYDIITKDVNDVVTPSILTCQFLVPNQANLSNTVPTGCSFNYTIDNGSPVTISAGNTVSINISNMSSNIILVLTKNNVIMDQITKSVVEIDVANGENGLNAPQTQWAYKNAISINSDDYPTAANSDTYINDWTSAAVPLTAQQISSGYATWQRQRTNTWTLVNNVNVKSYGQWSDAIRITGQNGQPGEDGDPGTAGADGKYTEFIYKHFTSAQTFGNNNNNPAYWAASQTQDYTGPSGYQWNDHPQGITETYKYEYMSQREYDGTTFGTFTTPVIWSSYGEKGQDGDGYEYVFLKHWDSTCPTIYDDDTYTKSGATISKADDDYCPYSTVRGQKVRWNNEPDEPDATGKYVFVSMRKKTDGNWGNFTTGKLWTWYVEDGEPGEEGPQGEQGPAGQNAVKYELVDQDSYANVVMDLDANNNITSELAISLKFRIARREGTTVRYMNASEMTGMAVYYRISKSTNSASSYYYYKLNLTTSGDTIAEYSITYTSSNDYVIDANKDIIVALVGSTNSSISDANITNYTMHDTVNLITTLQPNATLQIVKGQNASIKTLVTGQSGLSQQYSTLSQTMSGIQTDVVSLTNDVGGLETNMSTIQQTAEGVNSVVKSMYGLKDGVNLNLIKLSTFESISDTFGPNTTFKTSSPNNGYWWAQKSSENSDLLFTGFIQNSSVSYLGNSSLELNSYNFNYSSTGSPNADIDYKILNEQINTDSSTQKYCFSIYVKKKNTTGQNRVLLYVSGLSSSGALTDWTNKNNRNDESNVTANSVQSTSGSSLYQQFELTDTTWHRLFITFTAGSTTTSPIVGFRIYRNAGDSNPSTSTNFYNISMPKCEKSAKPTDWTYITDETTLSSQITQTANSISLTVTNDAIDEFSDQLDSGLRQTGISITDGLIELNSDNTVINGNLSIYHANEGLVIYDKNDATIPRVSITNGSIGTIGDDSFINSTIDSKAGPNSFNRPQNAGSTTIYLTGSKAMALGTYNNNKLTLDSFSGQITSSVRSEVSSISANLNISTDMNSYVGTNIYNGNCTVDSSTNHFNTYTGLTSPTSYLTGTYYLVGTLTVTFSTDNALSSTNRNLITTIRGTRETNAGQKIQTIGADGAVFKQTEQRYSWFGIDQQRLRYDNNILEVNTNGICANQQVRFTTSASTTPYITTTMGSNNCFKSRIYGNNAGNVTLDPYDTVITTTQVGITVTLPTCAIGKEYYIWNNSSGNITISPASVPLAAGKTVHLMQFPELRSGGSQPTGNWKVISTY